MPQLRLAYTIVEQLDIHEGLPLTPTNPKNSPRGMARHIPFTALLEETTDPQATWGKYTCSQTHTDKHVYIYIYIYILYMPITCMLHV